MTSSETAEPTARDAATEARTGIDRRTALRGAVWSVPVIAVAAAAPLAAASVEPAEFDLVYVTGPTLPTGASQDVVRGQTPWPDFTFQNVGPDAAPNVQVTFSVPTANNNPGATLALPNSGASAGWTLLNTFAQGGRDYYTFIMASVPVGQHTIRWAHVVGGPTGTSYTINANLEVNGAETNLGNNGGERGSGQLIVVA